MDSRKNTMLSPTVSGGKKMKSKQNRCAVRENRPSTDRQWAEREG